MSALSTGRRFRSFEILSPLGKGGMGEVYRAGDTRLDRTVAIKVLPEHLAESPPAPTLRARSPGRLEPEPSAQLYAL
jgi:serine/threonine protein kinase